MANRLVWFKDQGSVFQVGMSFEVAYSPVGGYSLRLKMAQKPYIVWSLGPKALI